MFNARNLDHIIKEGNIDRGVELTKDGSHEKKNQECVVLDVKCRKHVKKKGVMGCVN